VLLAAHKKLTQKVLFGLALDCAAGNYGPESCRRRHADKIKFMRIAPETTKKPLPNPYFRGKTGLVHFLHRTYATSMPVNGIPKKA
jgi:hypothetical protein